MDKNIGRKLDDRYEITELIGEGGMADVYKANDTTENKIVAVKILKKEFAENEEFLRRFRNESKAIALLSHQNIVKVFDVGFTDVQFIVMEYIDGITLKQFIEKEKVVSWKDSVHVIIQILRALQHAHKKGIVHRDIKPQNIMMLDDGTIKVMDFGIAKFAREDGKTATDQAIGSVHYISPEQASGKLTNEKSDIYSVGVMLYEMLTGQKPFDTDNPVSVAVMHMQNQATPPREINPDIPEQLEAIIIKAMEKEPKMRFASAADMIKAIEEFKNNPEPVVIKKEEPKKVLVGKNKKENTSQDIYTDPVDGDDGFYEDDDEYYDDEDEYYDDDYEDEEEEEEESRSLFIYVLTAFIIVVIIVAVIFFTSLIKNIFGGESVVNNREFPMVNLVGMDYNEVLEKYPQLNLSVVGSAYSEYAVDAIIEQDVEPGTTVKKGVEVNIKLSKGIKMVKVPSVTNMDYMTAQKALDQEGLKADLKFMTDEQIPEDYVIKTEPVAKTEVEPGSKVVVYVSKGPFVTTVIVPNFVGMTEEEAQKRCEYEELGWEMAERDSNEPAGTIIAQSLEPESRVDSGTKIVLTRSTGKAPTSSVSVSVNIPDDAAGIFKFVMYVEGVPTVEKSDVNAEYASSITLTVEGSGNQRVIVEVTNQANNKTAKLGTYDIDFEHMSYTTISEKSYEAFTAVDGLQQQAPETTPAVTTQQPTQTWWSPPQTEAPATTAAAETTQAAAPADNSQAQQPAQ